MPGYWARGQVPMMLPIPGDSKHRDQRQLLLHVGGARPARAWFLMRTSPARRLPRGRARPQPRAQTGAAATTGASASPRLCQPPIPR